MTDLQSYIILAPVDFDLFIEKANGHLAEIEIKHHWIPTRIENKCCLANKTYT
jgi:hypothetical protein